MPNPVLVRDLSRKAIKELTKAGYDHSDRACHAVPEHYGSMINGWGDEKLLASFLKVNYNTLALWLHRSTDPRPVFSNYVQRRFRGGDARRKVHPDLLLRLIANLAKG